MCVQLTFLIKQSRSETSYSPEYGHSHCSGLCTLNVLLVPTYWQPPAVTVANSSSPNSRAMVYCKCLWLILSEMAVLAVSMITLCREPHTVGIMNGSLKGGLIFGENDTLFVLTSTSCPDSAIQRKVLIIPSTSLAREHQRRISL